MASTIIHLAIAKKVKDQIEVDNPKDYYYGAIAPDISKQIGQDREISHFLVNTRDDIPNINLFVKRYPLFRYNSFNLGYFTHLYTDKLWNEKYLPNFVKENSIKLVDGTVVKASPEEVKEMIYSDYTNLNTSVIDEYGLDLSIFYEEFTKPTTNFQEIPIDQIPILLNKIGLIIENSKESKTYSFDFSSIKEFIDNSAEEIVQEIKKY